jgi:hypothetical protein
VETMSLTINPYTSTVQEVMDNLQQTLNNQSPPWTLISVVLGLILGMQIGELLS